MTIKDLRDSLIQNLAENVYPSYWFGLEGTKMLCEAFDKQIPKEPTDKIIVEPVIDQNGAYVDADVHITFHCPVCGEYVGCELEESHYNYCFECGQRIGWDNDNSGGDEDERN